MTVPSTGPFAKKTPCLPIYGYTSVAVVFLLFGFEILMYSNDEDTFEEKTGEIFLP